MRRVQGASALGLLALVLLTSTPSHARPRPKRAPTAERGPAAPAAAVRLTGVGQVTFVTAGQVFVDRGTAEGLEVGQSLALKRRGASVGGCKVTAVAEHLSSCVAQGVLKAGDRFSVDSAPEASPAPIAVPPGAEVLRSRLAVVEAAEVPLHDFEEGGGSFASVDSRIHVALRHDSWLRTGAGPFNRERLSVGIAGVEVTHGIRLWVDAQLAAWSSRPAGYRYPLPVVQPIIRRLELSWREPGRRYALALGRTWPLVAPGLVVLDGAQGSWRAEDGSLEAGAYGGALPDDITLVPSRRWTGGAFAALRVAGEEGSGRYLVASGRAAWLAVPGSSSRLEAQAALRAWSGKRFSGAAEVLVGAPLGPGLTSPGAVDAARLSVGVRPLDWMSFQVDGRYQSGTAGGFSDAALVVTGQSLRGGADFTFEILESLSLSLRAGGVKAFGNTASQLYLGPTLTWSRGGLGLEAGYLEELGWLRGRSAHLGAWVGLTRHLRLQGRGVWFEQSQTVAASGMAGRDFGASLLLDAELTQWLSLRISALGRTSPRSDGTGAALSAGLDLAARF